MFERNLQPLKTSLLIAALTRALNSLALFMGLMLASLSSVSVSATVFDYSNTNSISIPDSNSPNVCGSSVTRTITVSDSYTISDLDVGVVIDHTYSTDLIVTLISPMGTNVTIIQNVSTINDNEDFNVRLDDDVGSYTLQSAQDASVSYFQIRSTSGNSLTAFDGEAVNGVWTLSVCDDYPADTGSLDGFYLHIDDSGAADPLIVTSTADTNTVGTLRYAINHANTNTSDDAIAFNIAGLGPHLISPTSALPTITDDGVSIDGSSQGSTVCGGTPNTTGGMSNRKLRIVIFGSNHADNVLSVSSASNVTIKGLTIGDGNQNGLYVNNSDGLTLLCNHIGTSTDTTGAVPNDENGVLIDNSDNVIIGDGTLAGANAFGFNGNDGIKILSSNAPIIKRNFIGIGTDGLLDIGNLNNGLLIQGSSPNIVIGDASGGGNVISGNNSDGIDLSTTLSAAILGNFIGTNGAGTGAVANGDDGISLSNAANTTIGNGNINGRNIVGSNADIGILFFGSSSGSLNGNLIGIGTGGQTLGNRIGVRVAGTSLASVYDNIINNSSADGLSIEDTASSAIYSNSIFNNGGLAIDLGSDGLTNNDSNDGDTGPNNLLNFPVLNQIEANGSNLVNYDLSLDVPSHGLGYRVDFFANSTADNTGHGEGETHLGSIDISDASAHIGSFTASTAVAIGDIISATITRKTGPLTYDITSEFSANSISVSDNPASLIVAKNVTALNSSEYALPGNDVIYTITVTNEGDGSVDNNSVLLIDSLPAQITFFNGDHDGSGPSTDVIGFTETSTSLNFDPSLDAGFSDSLTKPANFSECNYAPASGYDPDVKYVCFNPKGQMLGGDPDPNFNISFRARIE